MSPRHLIELPEILADFPTKGPVCIEASAGTGKTYTLEHLLLKLIVEEGVPIEKVLVVTFTEKATLELIARLRERLLETRRTLAATEGANPSDLHLARRRIELALRSYDRACIKTIHGFCQETLSDGAMPAGLLLEQQLIAQQSVSREVLLEMVRARIDRSDSDGLALRTFLTRHGFEDLLTLHSAVTGERGALVPAWDLEAFRAVIPDDYPSAAEIDAWIAAKGLPRAGAPVKEGLGEGLAELRGVIESMGTDEIALAPDNPWTDWGETPIGASSRFDVAAKWLVKAPVRANPMGDRLAEIYFALLERAPQPTAFITSRIFPEVRALASARKRALGLLDYDDMLLRLDAALEGESGERLKEEVRERFSWVLIDEFQDTDALQWKIFSTLFGKESDEHRIVVVGDPKQAIYGFRGGDLPVYLKAREEIVAAGNPVRALPTSFRSTPRLLEVFGPLFEEHYFDGGLEAPRLGHGPEHDALTDAGGKELAPLLLLAAPDDRGCWSENKSSSGRALHRGLVDELLRLTDPAAPVLYRRKDAEPRALRHGDCMVLCHTGRECEAVGRALAGAGIPHAFFKQEGLMESAEASHLRVLLEALARPGDRSARALLWLTPFFELPLDRVEAVRELPETDPLHALPRAWAELAAERRFEALFDAILVESGLRRRLARKSDERSLTNYLHLCEHLLAAARREPLSVADLPRHLRAAEGGRTDDTDVRRLETERDAVQILTLHKAKGLEAPVVLLGSSLFSSKNQGLNHHFDTSCDVFHVGHERHARLPSRYLEGPTVADHDDAIARDTLREKQRLFYVAATRARARLVVPAALSTESRHPGVAALVAGTVPSGKRLAFAPGFDTFNRRIAALVEEPDLEEHFEIRALRDYLDDAPSTLAATLAHPHLPPLPETAPDLDANALRGERSAPVLTSYSRMKRGTDGLAPTELTARPPLDDAAETLPAGLEHDPILPGGVRTGLYLHTLLEETSFARVQETETAADFAADPRRLRYARRLAARHGLRAEAAERGLELCFSTLRRELQLGEVLLEQGLCAVKQHRPELPFVYPIPELAHPLLGAGGKAPGSLDALPFRVERGFVTGVIDLVFEQEGKVFFLDWKSDRLPDYAPAALAEHVASHYALQARLYTLAVTRLFGIQDAADYAARFGGLAYLYLRGEAPGGLHFERPEWSELVAWETGLLSHAEAAIARGESPESGEAQR